MYKIVDTLNPTYFQLLWVFNDLCEATSHAIMLNIDSGDPNRYIVRSTNAVL